jgi:hypothetical protein
MFAVAQISDQIRARLQQISLGLSLSSTAVIAGGAVLACYLGDPVEGDVDLWIATENPETPIATVLGTVPLAARSSKITITPYTIMCKFEDRAPLNIIGVWPVPEANMTREEAVQCVVKNFDFDCVRAYWDGTDLHVTSEFLEATKSRSLWAEEKERVVAHRTMERIDKYLKRGFGCGRVTVSGAAKYSHPAPSNWTSQVDLRSVPIRHRDLPAFWDLYSKLGVCLQNRLLEHL